MSHYTEEKRRKRLAGEQGAVLKPWGTRVTVALLYPNTYAQAMCNLGFLTIYHLLNSRDDILCERFFLPDKEELSAFGQGAAPLVSLESGRALRDFDLVAISISFENDYLHLPTLFELGRLPLFALDRDAHAPLVLCGGVCSFINPEPLAEIMDLFVVGEGEPVLPVLLDLLTGATASRTELLKACARIPGVYVPSLYAARYHDDGTFAGHRAAAGAPARIVRQWLPDLDRSASRSFVHSAESEFGDMSLVEISRGCSRGCRFCAAGFVYLPPRERSLAVLVDQVAAGLCQRNKIGLISPSVSDHAALAPLQQEILARGGEFSMSSLRIDSIDAGHVVALLAAGHRSVALAPEAASQRLRNLINKSLDETQILDAVKTLAAGGMLNLKLYFLLGLPTETDADIDALLALTEKIRSIWLEAGRSRGRLGKIILSVNPFIPKPFTPLQWAAMEGKSSLERKFKRLRTALAKVPNTEIHFESLKAARLQALLARADRRVGRALPLLAAGANLDAACRDTGISPDFFIERQREDQEAFPWEIIDNGTRRSYLRAEYRGALAGQLTAPCHPACRRCGVCGGGA
ncbi:MAG: radical SAM protein [Desulfuromonadales bacterium]|nr:radical SAM protein [Desulfuromonadales bacterium]